MLYVHLRGSDGRISDTGMCQEGELQLGWTDLESFDFDQFLRKAQLLANSELYRAELLRITNLESINDIDPPSLIDIRNVSRPQPAIAILIINNRIGRFLWLLIVALHNIRLRNP